MHILNSSIKKPHSTAVEAPNQVPKVKLN